MALERAADADRRLVCGRPASVAAPKAVVATRATTSAGGARARQVAEPRVRERDPPHETMEEPRLPDAPRPEHRHEPRTRRDEALDRFQIELTSDEAPAIRLRDDRASADRRAPRHRAEDSSRRNCESASSS